MLQDTFIGAIDEEMSQRLKTNPKHRELNLTKLAEELERLELIYHPTTPQLNNIRQSGGNDSSSLREIIREELAAALAKEKAETSTTQRVTTKKPSWISWKQTEKTKIPTKGAQPQKSRMFPLPVNRAL